MKKRSFWITLLLTVPVILILVFDPASTLSPRNFLGDIFGTIFFIDFPIGMCLLHYYFPQLFRHRKSGHYSIVPWGIFFLLCWGILALEMFFETQFGRYPENGFSVVSAYLFGWMYIWFTMIPIGLIYLLFRGIQKLGRKGGKKLKNKLEYIISITISLILLEIGFFYALVWYWSGFEWSPFGYETCGMEFIAILLLTYPAFILGLLIRLGLLFRWKYPHYVWYLPLILCGIASCAFAKSLEMGIFCIAAMLVLPIADFSKIKNAARKSIPASNSSQL